MNDAEKSLEQHKTWKQPQFEMEQLLIAKNKNTKLLLLLLPQYDISSDHIKVFYWWEDFPILSLACTE